MPRIYSSAGAKFTPLCFMALALEMHVQRCLRVTSTTEKLNFAAPKTRAWSHTAAGCSFQWGRWRGQTQSREPRGSPVGPAPVLPARTKDGDEGSRCSPAVASAAQMPAPYGSTDWHGPAGPRHGGNYWEGEGLWLFFCPHLPAVTASCLLHLWPKFACCIPDFTHRVVVYLYTR